LPIFLLRSRGFRVLQSLFFQFLGTVSPSSLPSSPRSLPEFRVFGPGSAGLYSYNPVPPLLHFDATSSVLPLRLPPSYRCPTSTASHLRKAPRISSTPFSIPRSRSPSFHPLSRTSEKIGSLLRRIAPGFGYPSCDRLAPQPLEASFSSRRSWASPFRAFLPTDDRQALSNPSLRSCASSRNLYSLGPALQRLPPTGGAVPLVAPQMVSPGRDLGSLGPFGLPRRSLRPGRSGKLLPFQITLPLF